MRARIGIAGVVALGALAGMVALVTYSVTRPGDTGKLSFAATTRAPAPFAEFEEAHVAVGGRCLRVLVATTYTQRVQGLRDVRALAPYDGMLFVFPRDSGAKFTLAQTPLPLDIVWYDAGRAPVGSARMTPCAGTDSTCPAYAARRRYRYALETGPGTHAGAGALGPCAA